MFYTGAAQYFLSLCFEAHMQLLHSMCFFTFYNVKCMYLFLGRLKLLVSKPTFENSQTCTNISCLLPVRLYNIHNSNVKSALVYMKLST